MAPDTAQVFAVTLSILTPVVFFAGIKAIDNSARRNAGKPRASWIELFSLSLRSYTALHWLLMFVTVTLAITLSAMSAELRGIDLASAWHLDVLSRIFHQNG